MVAIGNLAAVRSCLERSGDVGLAKDPKDHGVWQPFDAVFLEADECVVFSLACCGSWCQDAVVTGSLRSKLSEHAVIQAVKELQEDGCSVPFVAVTSDRTAKTKRRSVRCLPSQLDHVVDCQADCVPPLSFRLPVSPTRASRTFSSSRTPNLVPRMLLCA